MGLPDEFRFALELIKKKREEGKGKKGKSNASKQSVRKVKPKPKVKKKPKRESGKEEKPKKRNYSQRHDAEYYRNIEQEVLERYFKGVPYERIAKELNVSESFVYNVLKRNEVIRNKRGQYYHVTSKDLVHVIKLFKGEITRKDIPKIGNYYYRIYRTLKKLNIPPPIECTEKQRKQIIKILERHLKDDPNERILLDELEQLTFELNQIARRF